MPLVSPFWKASWLKRVTWNDSLIVREDTARSTISIRGVVATFPHETLTIKHDDQAGLVSMANEGKNGSQLFITLKATPHLDSKIAWSLERLYYKWRRFLAMITVEREGGRTVPSQRVTICDGGIGTGNTSKKKRSSEWFSASVDEEQLHQQQQTRTTPPPTTANNKHLKNPIGERSTKEVASRQLCVEER
jgi:cyclophilin family peptidyl-prolyl cis-trans isomerase